MSGIPLDPPASAPQQLRELWPLVRQYAASDDEARVQALANASTSQLRDLVHKVDATAFSAINSYLDETHDAEAAVPYGDLAQAALEAGAILRRRGESA